MTNNDSKANIAVWNALRAVIDPLIGLDIVTLGLVYDVEVEGATVRVMHTLTTPGCPTAKVIASGICKAVGAACDAPDVATVLVWDPLWHPGMIAPGAW